MLKYMWLFPFIFITYNEVILYHFHSQNQYDVNCKLWCHIYMMIRSLLPKHIDGNLYLYICIQQRSNAWGCYRKGGITLLAPFVNRAKVWCCCSHSHFCVHSARFSELLIYSSNMFFPFPISDLIGTLVLLRCAVHT